MTKYFVLEEQAIGDLRPLAGLGKQPTLPAEVDFMAGIPFPRDAKIELPIRFETDPTVPGPLPWLLKAGGPLMHDRMVLALRDVGVDNMEVYDTVLVAPHLGKQRTDYKAVNIIGRVSAVDTAKSEFDPSDSTRVIATKFRKLVLDESKANGLLLFRLAEKLSAIIVHEKVKDILTERRIGPLGFIETEQWFAEI